MPFTETTRITLEAVKAVELYKGVVLPPGSYPGTKTRTRISSMDGGVVWTPPRYRIELKAGQLANMGAATQINLSSEEIDVTAFVRQGQLRFRPRLTQGSVPRWHGGPRR